MVLIDAMKRPTPPIRRNTCRNSAKTSLQGVTGPIAFDDKGDLKDGPITLYVVKGGKWEALETVGGDRGRRRRRSSMTW